MHFPPIGTLEDLPSRKPSEATAAFDMIGRLPGFTFTDVGSTRGFAGTARPACVRRIPG